MMILTIQGRHQLLVMEIIPVQHLAGLRQGKKSQATYWTQREVDAAVRAEGYSIVTMMTRVMGTDTFRELLLNQTHQEQWKCKLLIETVYDAGLRNSYIP